MSRTIFSAFACLLLAGGGLVNADIFTESFESAPGTTYTLSAEFDDGFFDYFGRYMVPDNMNGARDDFQLGWDGNFGIHGQDHDGDNGNSATQSIMINGIDISGEPQLALTVALGALNSEPAFNNYEAADGDGIRIFASIDSGAFDLIGEFAPNATGEGDLYRDTGGNGIGNGARLTTELQDFSFLIAGTGSTLDIRIDLTSTGGFEPLAVDNVRIVPEPTSSLLLAAVGIGGLLRRRK